jgi:hypothetical protein
MLKDGDHIGKTQSAVVIEKLISQFLFEKASAADTGNTANPGNAGNAPAAAPKPATKATEGARK